MRCYYTVSGFTVSFNENDTNNFSSSWPCSNVTGKGAFAFDKNGDLVDIFGVSDINDEAWLAFIENCQEYGKPIFDKRHKKQLSNLI